MAEKPRIYIFHGDDPAACEGHIADIIKKMGDPGMAELNTSRLEGRQTNLGGLRSAAFALPFLSEHRLVILNNPLALAGGAENQKRFIDLLNDVPATTKLVLVVADELERGKWTLLQKHAWLKPWQAEHREIAFWQDCHQPTHEAMPGWILKQAKKMKGEISQDAAQALADHTGGDTGLATTELDKLFTYTNFTRPVTLADIELLVSPGGPVDIFTVVELMSGGQAAQAMHQLKNLLEQTPARDVFSMVIRQFRLLLQVRALLDEGGSIKVYSEMAKQPFLNKYVQQAGRFSLSTLEGIYHQLVEVDEAVKISQMSYELALEILVTELAK